MRKQTEAAQLAFLKRRLSRTRQALRKFAAQGRSEYLSRRIVRRYGLDNLLMSDLAFRIVLAEALRSVDFRMSEIGRDEKGKFCSKRAKSY